MHPVLVDANDVQPQPWRNGGGSTRELFAWPSAGQWRLRISLARVEQDGPFSCFPGVERWIALVEGAGMTLQLPSGAERLTAGREPLCFDGALAPGCSLERGATVDLNLMVQRSHGTGRMERAGDAVWSATSRWRGVFAATACTLRTGTDAPVELGAMALLMRHSAPGQPWSLGAQDAPVRAWWIAVETSAL